MQLFSRFFGRPDKGKREQQITEEVRRRVFEREQKLLEEGKRDQDAQINLQVLEEMTEILPADEIARIDREVRREYGPPAQQNASPKMLGYGLGAVFMLMFFYYLWQVPENKQETPRHIESATGGTSVNAGPVDGPAVEHPVPGSGPLPAEKPVGKPSGKDLELVRAVQMGLTDVVTYLLNDGANINTRAEEEKPLLVFAIEKQRFAIAQLLIDRGADVTAATGFRRNTALHLAAVDNQANLMEALVRHGADVSAPNRYGHTPAIAAGLKNRDEAVELLMRHGAVINTRHRDITLDVLKSTLKRPYQNERANLRNALLAPDVDVTDAAQEAGALALSAAAANGDPRLVSILLDMGVAVNALDRFGSTPLFSAAYSGSVAAAELLIGKGAYINVVGKYGFTPLICAVEGGCHQDFIKLLLEKGADTSIRSETGNDVFVYAKGRCGKEMLALLEQYR